MRVGETQAARTEVATETVAAKGTAVVETTLNDLEERVVKTAEGIHTTAKRSLLSISVQ